MSHEGRGRGHPHLRRLHPRAGAVLLLRRQGLQAQGLEAAQYALANARGKAFINLLPLEQGDRITTVLPLPEDEAAWERLDVMFATSSGDVRRNKLSDFVQVNRAGKIAMKLGEGEHILGVQLCDRGPGRAADHRSAAAASASP